VKYLVMIYTNPAAPWTGSEENYRVAGELLALDKELTESGELVSSEGLTPPSDAKTVQVRGGAPVVTDGPFAEAKELLAGYFLIDCPGHDRAVQIAARISDAVSFAVELRPVVDKADMVL
jgi:hypothetical protein